MISLYEHYVVRDAIGTTADVMAVG